MTRSHSEEPDDWSDEDFRSRGYDRPEPLTPSDAQGLLAESHNTPDAPTEHMLNTARAEIAGLTKDALSPQRRALRVANLLQHGPRENEWKERLDELALIGDQLAMEVRAPWQHSSEYAIMAAADVLTSGVTTLSAMRLLLAHGFVVDAEARWRALHELACTTALIAQDEAPDEIAKRFLVHGQRLPEGNRAYKEAWVIPRFYDTSYEWLRVSHPHLTKKGKPIPFRQSWLFEQAGLAHPDFVNWVLPSHGPVHLNSVTVARGSALDGPSPAGYDTHVTVPSRVAGSLFVLRTDCSNSSARRRSRPGSPTDTGVGGTHL